MYKALSSLFLHVFLITGIISAQEYTQLPSDAALMTISPRVGNVIDSIDIQYYRLFPTVNFVNSAQAYRIGNDNVLFLLKRFKLADTILVTTLENASTHLRYYIENFEHINESSVYSEIPSDKIANLAVATGYEGRSYKNVSISLTKRDNSVVQGTLLMITYNAVVISQRTGNYDWKSINNGLVYIFFTEIDKVEGAPIRYFRGNDQLLWKYFLSQYSHTGNTSFFMVADLLPIPSEVRKLIRKVNSSLETYPDYVSLDSLENIRTPTNKFSITINSNVGLSKYMTQHTRDWSNLSRRVTDSYDNSLYNPIELSVGYTLLNTYVGDRWALTGSVSLVVNSNILSSENSWVNERAGVQLHYFISPRNRLNYSGFDLSVFIGTDANWTEYSGVFKRTQETSEIPFDNVVYPMTFKLSSIFATTGLRCRYHVGDLFSVGLFAVGNYILQSSVPESVKYTWGVHGRNVYKSVGVAVPSDSYQLGTTISITI